MVSDIVERLKWRGSATDMPNAPTPTLCREAAAEIERLRAENFRLSAIACDTPTMGEWGNKGCAEIERLRAMNLIAPEDDGA